MLERFLTASVIECRSRLSTLDLKRNMKNLENLMPDKEILEEKIRVLAEYGNSSSAVPDFESE
jgi:hypothetical protein